MSTIDKALGLLSHFSNTLPEIGLAELKTIAGFDKATTHRYAKSLVTCGFLEQNQNTKAYRLGPALIRLAAIREETVPIAKIATDHIDQLADTTQELVHASLPQPHGLTTLYSKDGGVTGTRVGLNRAEILPFHATSSGIAMLAFGSPHLRENFKLNLLPSYTSKTSTNEFVLKAQVDSTLENGFSCANGTYEAEVCSVAVPFFDNTGHAAGTVAIATPISRMDEKAQESFVVSLIKLSRAFSNDIGGAIPQQLDYTWQQLEQANQIEVHSHRGKSI
jgi:DNA-binding IclR family transcriptional regulator